MLIQIQQSFVENMQIFMKCIKLYGGFYYEWYVGITSDPKKSFLTIHKIDMSSNHWILSDECSNGIAKIIKDTLVSIGCCNSKDLDLIDSDQKQRIYLFKMKVKH